MRLHFACTCAAVAASFACRASAEGLGGESDKPPIDLTIANADKGAFLPFSLGARIEGHAVARILSGYDSSYGSAVFDMNVVARVWGPVAIQAGAVLLGDAQRMRPSVGLRVEALKQEKHGVDAAVVVQYRPEGLTQSSSKADFGELEAVVAVSRNWGRFGTFANLVYGQDPDANDRDGEVRLSGVYTFTDRLRAGVDTRVRFDLRSSPANLAANHKATFDVVAGPTLSYVVGPVAVVAEAGYSGVELDGQGGLRGGLLALGGVGTAF